MAALCRPRAVTAESRFLRVFLFSRPYGGSGAESGSGSQSSESTEDRARPGGFASALERHSELQRKAELGRSRVSRGSCASDVRGGALAGWGRSPGRGRGLARGVERGAGAGAGLRPWAGPGMGAGLRSWAGPGGGAGLLLGPLDTLNRARAVVVSPLVAPLCGIYMLDLRARLLMQAGATPGLGGESDSHRRGCALCLSCLVAPVRCLGKAVRASLFCK